MDVHAKGVFLACRAFIPPMAEGGSIINIASIDGLRAGMARNIPYSVAKGGAVTLTKAMAVHHGRENIRVNCIAPGHIHASFVSNIGDEKRELRHPMHPLPCLKDPPYVEAHVFHRQRY